MNVHSFAAWLVFLFLCSTCLFTSVAESQPLRQTLDSLEWMAADSDVIVRGTVVAYARDKEVDEQTGVTHVMDTIVIRVNETLKGEHMPFVTFTIRNSRNREDVPRWERTHGELLLFLIDSARAKWFFLSDDQKEQIKQYPLTVRYVHTGDRGYLMMLDLAHADHTHRTPDVHTLDLKVLNQPEELIQATHEALAAAQELEQLQAHKVEQPLGAEPITLIVPIDHRLEQEAQKWVRSDDGFLRREGAKALQYFPTDENIVILKSLLNDPAWSMLHKHVGEERITLGREYYVRKAAFESLKAMGIDVEQPVLLEPVSDGSN